MILRPGNFTPNVWNFVTKMSCDKQCKSILKSIWYLGGCVQHIYGMTWLLLHWFGALGIRIVCLVFLNNWATKFVTIGVKVTPVYFNTWVVSWDTRASKKQYYGWRSWQISAWGEVKGCTSLSLLCYLTRFCRVRNCSWLGRWLPLYFGWGRRL